MTLILLVLILAVAVVTAVVLADSGLRLWSAFGGLKAKRATLANMLRPLPVLRVNRAKQANVRVSYVAQEPLRAAA